MPSPKELDDKQIRAFKEAFEYFDDHGEGWLETRYIKKHLAEMGYNSSDLEVAQTKARVDPKGTGRYDFDAFLSMVENIVCGGSEGMEDELKNAFRMFDKEGTGTISVDVLREIMQAVDPNMDKKELDQMIRETDSDGSGTVDFDEFLEFFTA